MEETKIVPKEVIIEEAYWKYMLLWWKYMKLITRMGPEGEMMLIGEMIGRMEVTISPVHGPRCAWQVLSCLTYEVLAIKC